MFVFSLLACTSLFLSPEEGDYIIDVSHVRADSACEDEWGVEFDSEYYSEIDVADDSMEIDDEIECDRSGAEFSCEYEDESDVTGYSATLTSLFELDGTWTSNTTFEAEAHFEFTCSGSDCGDLSKCEADMDWEAELDD